ncbi:MAG: hypothetical protein ACYDAZ_08705, partial [Thermoplasmataceae archaeon]
MVTPTKTKLPSIQFKQWTCTMDAGTYPSGRPGINLIDQATGDCVCSATINLPDAQVGDGEVIIKDYAECEGMLEAFIKAGVVEPTGRMVDSGFVTLPICRLLVDLRPDASVSEREEYALMNEVYAHCP